MAAIAGPVSEVRVEESRIMTSLILRKLIFHRSMGIRHFLFKVMSYIIRPRIQMAKHVIAFDGVGLEIGGPSPVFRVGGLFPVYETAKCVDNVNFSSKTCWEGDLKDGQNFYFHPKKEPGTQFIGEGGSLSSLPNEVYDFVLSCHMLEHAANPLGVLQEWKRLLKMGGKLMLILPHKDGTFDHLRPITELQHLIEDFENSRGEDDATHLQEILTMHDLRRDPQQASTVDFEKWIKANKVNRGAHQHVFDMNLSAQMLTQSGFQMLAMEAARPFHIFLLATKLPLDQKVNNKCFLGSNAEPYRKSPFRTDRLRGNDIERIDISKIP